jgi:hypothetical protein
MQQFIVVDYFKEEKFIIPKGINLKDKKQVKWYGVKYNVLYIELTNGELVEVEGEGWLNSADYKYPSSNVQEAEIEEEECEEEEDCGEVKDS